MTDKSKFNSISGIYRIYSLSFTFWTGRLSKMLSYPTPLHNNKQLRNLYCVIIGAVLITGTIASSSTPSVFGDPYVNIAAAGDWRCTGNTRDTVKCTKAEPRSVTSIRGLLVRKYSWMLVRHYNAGGLYYQSGYW